MLKYLSRDIMFPTFWQTYKTKIIFTLINVLQYQDKVVMSDLLRGKLM